METICRPFQRKPIQERRPSACSLGGSSAKSHIDVSRLGKRECILLLKEEKNFRGLGCNTVSVLKITEENGVHAGFTWAAGINSYWEVFANVLKRKPDHGAEAPLTLYCFVLSSWSPSQVFENRTTTFVKIQCQHYREKNKVFALQVLCRSGPYHLKSCLFPEEKTPNVWVSSLIFPPSIVSFERLHTVTISSKGITRFSTCLVYPDMTTNTAHYRCFCFKLPTKYSGRSFKPWAGCWLFLNIGAREESNYNFKNYVFP